MFNALLGKSLELFQITTQKGLLCAGYNNVIIHNADLTLLCYELTTSLHPIATFIGATTYFTLLYLQAQNSKLLFKESNTDPVLDRLYSIYQYKKAHLESLKTEYENLSTLFSGLVSQLYELQQTLKLIFPQKKYTQYPVLSYQSWKNAFEQEESLKNTFLKQAEQELITLEHAILLLHEQILLSLQQAIAQRNSVFAEINNYLQDVYKPAMHISDDDYDAIINTYQVITYLEILLSDLDNKQDIVHVFIQKIIDVQAEYAFFSLISTEEIIKVESQNNSDMQAFLQRLNQTNEQNKEFLAEIIKEYQIYMNPDFKLALYDDRADAQKQRIQDGKNTEIKYITPGGPDQDPDDENDDEITESDINEKINKYFDDSEINYKNKFTKNVDRLLHMFRDAIGHFKKNTPFIRNLIRIVANKPENIVGKNKAQAIVWYTQTLKNGCQIWAKVRNYEIIEAGINKIPKYWNPILERLI